ncbi:Holliday junction branch migration complex subunit RuvA [Dirofilaria immitis]
MLRCSLFYLIFYLGFLILPTTLNETDTHRNTHHSKLPYKHFGRHYEYIYEMPSILDRRSRFHLSYDTIGGDTNTIGTIGQKQNAKNHKRKHWESNAEKIQFSNEEPETSLNITNIVREIPKSLNSEDLQKANIKNAEDAWKESENTRRQAQKEYEIVRQFADDMFNQAKISRHLIFNADRISRANGKISNFRHSAPPEDTPVLLSEGFLAGKVTNPGIYTRRSIMKNGKQKMKANKEVMGNHGENAVRRWRKNGFRNDASYQMFGTLLKFDPRFPFDRAYKLMESLRPPEIFKFPLNNFNI